jgi:hypothetical protein
VTIEPSNLTAQLHHRAAGNPPSTLPGSAISNAFPGLELDIRNVWRRVFVGLEIHEARGLVLAGEGPLASLEGAILVAVDGHPVVVGLHGPTATAEDANLNRAAFLEWSNALAQTIHEKAGSAVPCDFVGPDEQPPRTVDLTIRNLFAMSEATGATLPLIAEELADPGQLTQSLCSPWQNDYRECGCYYWAASRPDYVNVETTGEGTDIGNSWMARERTPKRYTGDDSNVLGQLTYDDLFRDWQGQLRFIVGGRDHD